MIQLVSERYYRPTRLFVTGIGAAMILPWIVLFSRRRLNSNPAILPNSGDLGRLDTLVSAPWLVQFLAVWLFLLLLRYLFDLAGEWLRDDGEEQFVWRTVMLVLFIIMLPLLNRILLYPYFSAPMFAPTRGILNAIFNFTQGWRPDNVLLFFYISCWIFVVWVSSNVMGSFEVGRLFAVGLLSVALSVGWLQGLGENDYSGLLFPFLLCGLAALTLSLIDNKVSRGYHSPGRRFSLFTVLQLGGATLIFTVVASWLSSIITPNHLRAITTVLRPVWWLIGIIAGWIWFVLEPIVEFLFNILANMIEALSQRIDFSSVFQGGEAETGEQELQDFGEVFANSPELRFLLIGIFVLIGLLILWVVFNRTILKRYRNEFQQEIEEDRSADSGLLSNAFSQLRSWIDAIRGLRPKSLLEPDTVENIYANICRLASRQGFNRAVSQTPDQYLPDLFKAFPGYEEPLTALTLSYMEVYYGDAAVSPQQLDLLKSHYNRIAESIPPEDSENDAE